MRSVVPAVKALMAKELVEQHGLKQDHVAQVLGISQSAVSKYSRKVRGSVIEADKLEEVQPLITNMTVMLMDGEHQRAEFLQLFCMTCAVIRKSGIVCRFCKKSDPKIKIEECCFCFRLNPHQDGR